MEPRTCHPEVQRYEQGTHNDTLLHILHRIYVFRTVVRFSKNTYIISKFEVLSLVAVGVTTAGDTMFDTYFRSLPSVCFLVYLSRDRQGCTRLFITRRKSGAAGYSDVLWRNLVL